MKATPMPTNSNYNFMNVSLMIIYPRRQFNFNSISSLLHCNNYKVGLINKDFYKNK